jgi:hypothetical protein
MSETNDTQPTQLPTALRDTNGQFDVGSHYSGNPNGRPKAGFSRRDLRAYVTEDEIQNYIRESIKVLLATMASDDKRAAARAAKDLLDTVTEFAIAKPKQVAPPFTLSEPPAADATLTEQGGALLAGANKGEVPSDQAANLLMALGSLAAVTKVDELETRITALEQTRKPLAALSRV